MFGVDFVDVVVMNVDDVLWMNVCEGLMKWKNYIKCMK